MSRGPFAAPSKLSIHVSGKTAGFPRALYETRCRRLALQDELTRQFSRRAAQFSFQAKGSGQSGLISVSRCGPEVLERTACRLDGAGGRAAASGGGLPGQRADHQARARGEDFV